MLMNSGAAPTLARDESDRTQGAVQKLMYPEALVPVVNPLEAHVLVVPTKGRWRQLWLLEARMM